MPVCRQAIILANELGSKADEGAALRVLAQIHLQRGEYEEARRAAQVSLRLLTEVNHVYEIARTQVTMAEIALAEGDEAAFQSAAEAAYPTLERLKATPELNRLREIYRKVPK